MWRTPVPEGLFPTKRWLGRLRNNSVIENNVCIASKRMKDKSKISEFSNRLRKATPTYDEDDFCDPEEWELLAELRDNEDFPALVEYCKRRAKQLPDYARLVGATLCQ